MAIILNTRARSTTLADTAFEDAPRISSRVTFLADEFIRSGEYKVITPVADTPAPEVTATDKGENFTITDDNLGDGGAKTKFRKAFVRQP